MATLYENKNFLFPEEHPHQYLVSLNKITYSGLNKSIPQGWTVDPLYDIPDINGNSYTKNNNGFAASVYKKGNEIVVSYRGSDQLNDFLGSDRQIALRNIPEQLKNARLLFNKVEKDNPQAKITLTGHSLGGNLAQMVAAENPNTEAITFNAAGTGHRLEKMHSGKNLSTYTNITNYGIDGDATFSIFKQPGTTLYISPPNHEQTLNDKFDILGGVKKGFIDNHGLNNFFDIFEAQPKQFTREDIAKMDIKTFEQNWTVIQNQMRTTDIPSEKDLPKDYSSYKNPELGGSGKIFTREEIGKMNTGEFTKNEKAINYQMKTIGVPSSQQLQSSKSSSNSSGGSSGNGHWVTINGNHVFIEK
jgi:hypothetical protein